MAIYIVGDIQGCYSELKALLKQVKFNKNKDQLWAAGDVVARGPDSLKTLRYLKSLGKSAKLVLGNHDLHLLAIHAGIKHAKKSDLLEQVLNAPDVDELMTWLAKQPLLRKIPKANAYMSHAGISPQWKIKKAQVMANFVQKKLSSKQRNKWLAHMYGEKPNSWHEAKTNSEKFRFTVNSFTRMRYCHLDLSLEFNCKQSPNNNDNDLKPWYELSPVVKNTTWLFGHWASLMGECPHKNVYALDTGCVWGNHLTMLRWHDKKYFTQAALNT